MKHPGAVLQALSRGQNEGARIALVGTNPYVKGLFRRVLLPQVTSVQEELIDPVDVRESLLRIRDTMQTTPFQWEKPMLWIEGAEHMFSSMSFPEDFPTSSHIVVCVSETDEVYMPPSFTAVVITMKGAGATVQDLVKWLITYKGMSGDIEVLRFLAGEYKDNFPSLEKLLDLLYLKLYPRTILTMKDLDSANTGTEWNTDVILRAILANEEAEAINEMMVALKTFHPKGIVTILSRRVLLLMQIATAVVLNNGSPDPGGDIKPWVWRQNVEFVKEIPEQKLFRWALALDKAYASLSRGKASPRWTLIQMMSEMTRV